MRIPPYKFLEYYKLYNLDYWPSKIAFLKNSIENFNEVKSILYKGLDEPNENNFLLSLKTDLHFLYFQMVETLFELIFALENYDDKNLWHYLSFSDRNNYNKIKEIANGDNDLFIRKIKLSNPKNNDEKEISFLRYVFFYLIDLEKIGFPKKDNISVISKLIRKFAYDFSDRKEYNAFKHSMRLIYEKPNPVIETVDKKHSIELKGENAFTYIDKYETDKHLGVSIVTKSFYPDIDIKLCSYCSWLIYNVIVSRKNSFFGTDEPIISFETINLDKINELYTGIGRMEQNFYNDK